MGIIVTDGAVSIGAYQYDGVVAKIGEGTSWTSATGTYSTIQETVNAASAGNTIVLASASILMSDAEVAANGISITKSLTITGEENDSTSTIVRVTDQGITASRVFTINASSSDININNMAIMGGDISVNDDTANFGGGIYITAGSVALDTVIVTGSKALSGGGLYSAGNSVVITITDSELSYNSATRFGGAIYCYSSLEISASTISYNSADHSGGGISIMTGDVDISSSTISHNTSSGSGGGNRSRE